MAVSQIQKAQHFRSLHVAGRPLVLHNVWDAGSAVAVAGAGAPAVATGSWSVAAAHGAADGEQLALDLVIANIARIVAAVPEVPVSLDLESGYGATSEQVGQTISRAIAAGVVGCNLEDSDPASGLLRDTAVQSERLAAARRVAAQAGIPFFINARCDVFFQSGQAHDVAAVDAALARAEAYARAGADGIFLPGLADPALIQACVRRSPLPVNIMAGGKSPPLSQLAAAGVSRVSHGPGPYRAAMALLQRMVRDDPGG